MKSGLKLLVIAALAIVVVELFVKGRGGLPDGHAAPDFTLASLSGGEVTLSALRGKVVAVNFWATWCPPCKAEIPDFAAVYANHQGRCLEFLGVAEQSGTREEIAEAARQLGINYPVLLDESGEVGEAWRVPGYPRTVLVDVDGKVRKVFEGMIGRAELEEALAPLLAEAPASCPRRAL